MVKLFIYTQRSVASSLDTYVYSYVNSLLLIRVCIRIDFKLDKKEEFLLAPPPFLMLGFNTIIIIFEERWENIFKKRQRFSHLSFGFVEAQSSFHAGFPGAVFK